MAPSISFSNTDNKILLFHLQEPEAMNGNILKRCRYFHLLQTKAGFVLFCFSPKAVICGSLQLFPTLIWYLHKAVRGTCQTAQTEASKPCK